MDIKSPSFVPFAHARVQILSPRVIRARAMILSTFVNNLFLYTFIYKRNGKKYLTGPPPFD